MKSLEQDTAQMKTLEEEINKLRKENSDIIAQKEVELKVGGAVRALGDTQKQNPLSREKYKKYNDMYTVLAIMIIGYKSTYKSISESSK